MKLKAGQVFRLSDQAGYVPGCTASEALTERMIVFSLAPHTDISPEAGSADRLRLVLDGTADILTPGQENRCLQNGDICLLQKGMPTGIQTETGVIYLEISGKENTMHEILKSGKVFALKDMIPVQEGKILNMDLMHDDSAKLALMSFGAGTGLAEHAAPGDALVFALDGEGIIGYEGKEYPIHAGENFKFDAHGRHYVRAVSDFRMALLVTFEQD